MLRLFGKRKDRPGCFAVVGANRELLQVLRATHALAESGWHLHVEPEEGARWRHLERHFGVSFEVGTEDVAHVRELRIDHAAPTTALGYVERPLIFPHSVADRCRALWVDTRPIGFSFAGLMTLSRRETLDAWTARTRVEAEIFASDRGRVWPGKAWDDDYFATLGRSRFVLCPNGDHVWTYRFFEAALCGAVPVVEGESVHYRGFRYARMSDDPASLTWRLADAVHNYEMARSLLCVPTGELRQALFETAARFRT